MAKRVRVSEDDIPGWAIKDRPIATSCFASLDAPRFPQSDGRNFTAVDLMVLKQFKAMTEGVYAALEWLLILIADENIAALKEAPRRRSATVDASEVLTPLAPALSALGLIKLGSNEQGVTTICFDDWFLDKIEKRSKPGSFEPVRCWLSEGGLQKPPLPESWD
ncbi:hypothetical protein ABDK56_02660 [Sphingomonas sp. ASV193]|uniref:hypothetical protein n=1 Tax=Sphingomonas sp. ASV193 TaxID=3144405 RepID=UPI0032E8D3FA